MHMETFLQTNQKIRRNRQVFLEAPKLQQNFPQFEIFLAVGTPSVMSCRQGLQSVDYSSHNDWTHKPYFF